MSQVVWLIGLLVTTSQHKNIRKLGEKEDKLVVWLIKEVKNILFANMMKHVQVRLVPLSKSLERCK